MDDLLARGEAGAEIVVAPRGTLALPPEFVGAMMEPAGMRVRIVLADGGRAPALVAWLAAHGHEVHALVPQSRSLEDLFMEMFQGAHDVGGDPEREASAPVAAREAGR
jgi:hypothetical protein